jgi:hypothetical protein
MKISVKQIKTLINESLNATQDDQIIKSCDMIKSLIAKVHKSAFAGDTKNATALLQQMQKHVQALESEISALHSEIASGKSGHQADTADAAINQLGESIFDNPSYRKDHHDNYDILDAEWLNDLDDSKTEEFEDDDFKVD